MRDIENLDNELRLVSAVRAAIRSEGGDPSLAVADRLLDERPSTQDSGSMAIMTKLFITVLAVLGIALGTSTPASADENDFVSSIASLDYYAIECAGCAQDALDVGYRACAGFDRGGSNAAVQAVLQAYNGPGQENREYYATLFAQYAAYQLCPEHNGEIGPI